MDKGQLGICAGPVASLSQPDGSVLSPEPQGKPRGPAVPAAPAQSPGFPAALPGLYHKPMSVSDPHPRLLAVITKTLPNAGIRGSFFFFSFLPVSNIYEEIFHLS